MVIARFRDELRHRPRHDALTMQTCRQVNTPLIGRSADKA